MRNKKNVMKVAESVVARLAKKTAGIEANTACPILGYQSKEPQKVKELRKF